MTTFDQLIATGALIDTRRPRGTLRDWLAARLTPAWANAVWIGGAVALVVLAEILR